MNDAPAAKTERNKTQATSHSHCPVWLRFGCPAVRIESLLEASRISFVAERSRITTALSGSSTRVWATTRKHTGQDRHQ